jgi:hypothetical protein
MMVGSYTPPEAVRWDGSKWSSQSFLAHNTTARINAVSCASRNACIAVGTDQGGDPIAVRWDGMRWTLQRTPKPTGLNDGELDSVSCVSPAMCTAVGHYFGPGGGNDLPLAERWNGRRWLIERARLGGVGAPGGGTDLNGVSCPSPTACMAVGTFSNGGPDRGIAEFWNGSRWSLARASGFGLNTVSCFTIRHCLATGGGNMLAAWWNGTRWTIQNLPLPANINAIQDAFITGVSCPSSMTCIAVGYWGNVSGVSGPLNANPFVERWTRPVTASPPVTG